MGHQMTRDAFRQWAEGQTARYERIAGEPVAMSPERVIHARLKARVWQALDREIRAAGLPCEALPDGVTVEVGEDTDYEPDAIVNCGPPLPDDVIAVTNPVIVVEVLSPSASGEDLAGKLVDYFRVTKHPALSDRAGKATRSDPAQPRPNRRRRHTHPCRGQDATGPAGHRIGHRRDLRALSISRIDWAVRLVLILLRPTSQSTARKCGARPVAADAIRPQSSSAAHPWPHSPSPPRPSPVT